MKFADLPHGNAALAIFPSYRGFGWMVFDGPVSPYRWGVAWDAQVPSGDQAKNEKCLAHASRLLVEFKPAVLVLEAFEGPGTRRYERIQQLCRSLISLASVESVPVRVLTRLQIEATFVSRPAKTRYDVATVSASYLREIQHRLPGKRQLWENEKPDMALMNAAALLIVHYANPQQPL